jgi:Fe-S cluster biosynthesis and repair protein YggX
MARMVQCVKLQRELPAIQYKPFDDELGQRIYENVSQEAWMMWLEHSKMIVNEYQLDLVSEKAHQVLREQCEAYFFGEGAALPPDYVPAPAK